MTAQMQCEAIANAMAVSMGPRDKPPTVRELAAMLGVSERLIHLTNELRRTGREDLCERVAAGELTTMAALRLAKPEKYDRPKDTWAALVRAWNAATEDEKERLLAILAGETHGVAPGDDGDAR